MIVKWFLTIVCITVLAALPVRADFGAGNNLHGFWARKAASVVAISQTANPAGVDFNNTATYTDQSIGVAAADRIVVVLVGSEDGQGDDPVSATIDYGTGAQAMTAGTLFQQGNVSALIFYLAVPTGTTATIVVTFDAAGTAAGNHISVYRIVGANGTPASSGGDASTDMDSTDPLTTGSITIPTNGGFLAVAAGGTDTNAKAWTTGEDLDEDFGNGRYTTAFSTTPATTTITVTGTSNGEDGALAYIIFNPAS